MPGSESPSYLDPEPDSGLNTDPAAFQHEPSREDQIPNTSYSSLEDGRDGGVGSNGNGLFLPPLANSEVGGMTADARNDNNIEEAERNGIEIAAAVLGQPQRVGEVPFYTGGQTGPTYALGLCSPEKSLPTHFLIPSHTQPPFSEADRHYLEAKGVLSLPGKESCEALLRAYLHHVHPIMPVIEVDNILNYQHNGRLHEYNILLLWSVFFAAVNFVPQNVFIQEGFKSRREMKATLYSRAKCVYAVGEGLDKIVLLQASLLMGFWISELDEHMQPWYWTGTAINLCHMLGLHRNPDASRINPAISNRQRLLWRRLWWSSFYRDRWLGFNFGRPLRINLNDCDTPMPRVTDLLDDVAGVPEPTLSAFLPHDLSKLASYWVTLIELSKHLGNVLNMNYLTIREVPTIEQFECLEGEILNCRLPDQYELGLTSLERFHSFHVHLHYQVLLIALYRPYGSETPTGLNDARQGTWQHRMRLKAGDAASQTNDILDNLAEENLLQFAGPMTPALLVPAMQTHLLFYKSADSIAKRLRLHKLEMCMLIMEELGKTYTIASIYRGIFLKAMHHICSAHQTGAAGSAQTTISVPPGHSSDSNCPVNEDATSRFGADTLHSNSAFMNSSDQDLGIMGGFVDALTDDSSIFNIWETLNQM
ncbi:hypothetical protein BDV24DRAFT_140595 [Aspergillus arachidicola]|nr:hypothetical protein BDV24DRAFT_140595 [Aspergillus arachidicola]